MLAKFIMRVWLKSLYDYDREFHPEVVIDDVVFFRGKLNGVRPQQRAHDRARELGHKFYVAYNSYFSGADSYSFASFPDYGAFEMFFDKHSRGTPKHCRFFEQMVGRSKFFLDVDISPFPTEFTGEQLIEQIHMSVDRCFQSVFGTPVFRENWRITDSTKVGEKMSYHMILCNSGCFTDTHTHMFTFFHMVMEDFMAKAPPIMTRSGAECPLDKGVYTINRNFRLVNNVKHKNVGRPLVKISGQEDLPDCEFAATVCDSEATLSEDMVYSCMEKTTSFVGSKRAPGGSGGDGMARNAKRSKAVAARNLVSLDFMHGARARNVEDLLLFDYDRVDIEAMVGEGGSQFRDVTLVSTFPGNPVKQVEFSRPFIAGYSFNFDRRFACPLCGGKHENNHVWVMYDSHLNRYMKQHSTNCVDRTTVVPYTPRGLRLWQTHYEQRVWKGVDARASQSLLLMFMKTLGISKDEAGSMWTTTTGMCLMAEPHAAGTNMSTTPRSYYFVQMDDVAPPYHIFQSKRPWCFSDRTFVCSVRSDLFKLGRVCIGAIGAPP